LLSNRERQTENFDIFLLPKFQFARTCDSF